MPLVPDPIEQAKGKSPKEIAALGFEDPVFFCRYFLPEAFPKRMPWLHRGILAILTKKTDFLWTYGEVDKIVKNFVWKLDWRDPSSPEFPIFQIEGKKIYMTLGVYNLLMLPRGFSKTTIAGLAVPLYIIVYRLLKFMVYCSEASTHATMQVLNIRNQLDCAENGAPFNQRLFDVFGRQSPTKKDPELWREDFFETINGVAIMARSRGAQIRGLNHKSQRPQLILPDDVEDEESVKTEEQRIKTRKWAYGSLMPALPEMDENASITAMGTMLHPESLLATWARDPQWTVIKIGPIDKDGEEVWPENLTKQKLRLKKEAALRAGTLDTFYLEYMGEIVAPDAFKFKQENIIYDKPGDEPLQVAVYCDPAISEKRRADRAWVIAVGMSGKGRHFVLDTWCKRGATPREIVDKFFEFSIRWKAQRHGIESNAYQAALVYLVREDMYRPRPGAPSGHFMEVEAVTHKSAKDSRIRGVLQPRFGNGYIAFTKRFIDLELELLEYGQPGVHDDGPDCLAGAIVLLQPYAAQAAGEGDLGNDQFPPLEEVLGKKRTPANDDEDWDGFAEWESYESFIGTGG